MVETTTVMHPHQLEQMAERKKVEEDKAKALEEIEKRWEKYALRTTYPESDAHYETQQRSFISEKRKKRITMYSATYEGLIKFAESIMGEMGRYWAVEVDRQIIEKYRIIFFCRFVYINGDVNSGHKVAITFVTSYDINSLYDANKGNIRTGLELARFAENLSLRTKETELTDKEKQELEQRLATATAPRYTAKPASTAKAPAKSGSPRSEKIIKRVDAEAMVNDLSIGIEEIRKTFTPFINREEVYESYRNDLKQMLVDAAEKRSTAPEPAYSPDVEDDIPF